MTTTALTAQNTRADFDAWATEVAAALAEIDGAGWTYEPNTINPNGWINGYLVFFEPGGLGRRSARIMLDWSPHNSKCEFSPVFPAQRGRNDVYVRDSEAAAKKISATAGRDPNAVARDIVRKFLPGYFAQATVIDDMIARNDAYAEREVATDKRLTAAALKLNPNYSGGYLSAVQGGYGNVKAHPDTADIELRGLPVETVVAILELLAR